MVEGAPGVFGSRGEKGDCGIESKVGLNGIGWICSLVFVWVDLEDIAFMRFCSRFEGGLEMIVERT